MFSRNSDAFCQLRDFWRLKKRLTSNNIYSRVSFGRYKLYNTSHNVVFRPNAGFLYQLWLYESMGNCVDITSNHYKTFRTKQEQLSYYRTLYSKTQGKKGNKRLPWNWNWFRWFRFRFVSLFSLKGVKTSGKSMFVWCLWAGDRGNHDFNVENNLISLHFSARNQNRDACYTWWRIERQNRYIQMSNVQVHW